MKHPPRNYVTKDIDVMFYPERCTHVAECVNGLPAVFDTSRRPWVKPEHASADEVARVILCCPTGALHFTRKDGGEAEPVPETNTIRVVADGPLYVLGRILIESPEGDFIMEDTRVALCRCGVSKIKPLCDNAHLDIHFKAPGQISASTSEPAGEKGGLLKIIPLDNGPFHIQGPFVLISEDGKTEVSGTDEWLCRCGLSNNKPFCDGSHFNQFTG